jgi:hypothetical protein
MLTVLKVLKKKIREKGPILNMILYFYQNFFIFQTLGPWQQFLFKKKGGLVACSHLPGIQETPNSRNLALEVVKNHRLLIWQWFSGTPSSFLSSNL